MSIIKNNKNYGIETKITSAPPQVQYDQLIFTNVSGEANQLTIKPLNGNNDWMKFKNCKYSVDGGAWVSLPSDSDGWSTQSSTSNTPFNNELIIQWDKSHAFGTGNKQGFRIFSNTKNCNVSGNLNNGDAYCYVGFFGNNTHLVDASGLKLNAEILNEGCYYDMFYNCVALTSAPTLPAIILSKSCYQSMFYGCTSLTTAPALPAANLVGYCYNNMFNGCTSLTTAPTLPATKITEYSYASMFAGCISLTTAPTLPATILERNCCGAMFQGCTSLTSVPATLPATTLAQSCYLQMFSGCTSLTTAPALPATTLVNGCYRQMFQGCTSLNRVETQANSISASNCINNWLDGVSATGDFYNLGTATYSSGASGIPSGWTVHTSL